ncbi:MAG: polyprenyl synthetase family protein [Micrococcales bacterium]|nr:polyprenyl synthetase family protein [Micrococcales bacterium]
MPSTTDVALSRLLAEGRARAAATDPEHAELWEALADASEGGKRFRPALVTATHDALGGNLSAAVVQVGAAVELLHTAFVIHDDVIDRDDLRRGRLNVSGTFRARARAAGATPDGADDYARTAGILAGDLALAAAIRTVATCGASTPVVGRLLDLFDGALHTTAAGELADVRLSLGVDIASVPQSLAMAADKTSAYSFSLPLQAGAVLAGADESLVDRLGQAGRALGIAFQLIDDLIGVFGDPLRTGKSATSDLRACKQTPLLAHARSTLEWTHISAYLGRDLTEDELTKARSLLTTSGSRQFVEDLSDAHLCAANAVVEELGIPLDCLAGLTTRAPVFADSVEVAA